MMMLLLWWYTRVNYGPKWVKYLLHKHSIAQHSNKWLREHIIWTIDSESRQLIFCVPSKRLACHRWQKGHEVKHRYTQTQPVCIECLKISMRQSDCCVRSAATRCWFAQHRKHHWHCGSPIVSKNQSNKIHIVRIVVHRERQTAS